MSALNIGFTCFAGLGGSGTLACELALWLSRRGHNLHYIGPGRPFRLLRGRGRGINFHTLPGLERQGATIEDRVGALARHIRAVAARARLDILHAHYALPHALAAHMARLLPGGSAPFLTTLHGTDVSHMAGYPEMRDSVAEAVDGGLAVTAVSPFLEVAARARLGLAGAIRVIPNFVDTRLFRPKTRKPSADGGQRTIVHVSNLRPVKRPADLLHIFSRIRAALPARLLVVGDGGELPGLQTLAQELGLAGHVHFLGRVQSPHRILQYADLFLLPSEHESFGLAALEAMACGVPVVASHTGGLPGVVEHGRSGFLCEVGDIADFAARAIEILQDNSGSFGRAARAASVERYAIESVAPQYENLYRSLLA